jgi:hypothetical protein
VFLVRLLLGGGPPPFDKVQQRLTAAAQTLTLLEFVKESDGLARKRSYELVLAFSRKTSAIGTHFLGFGRRCENLHATDFLGN